jgi:DNA-binding response OmpR family regulator
MPIRKSVTARHAYEAKPKLNKRTSRRATAERTAGILSVSPSANDHETLRQILKDVPWNISVARTLSEAVIQLQRERVPLIVVCESQLPDGTWKDVLNHIVECQQPPSLIVTSRLADEYLWAEVLNLGAYDVLSKPFNEREVRHVLGSVWERTGSELRAHAAGV